MITVVFCPALVFGETWKLTNTLLHKHKGTTGPVILLINYASSYALNIDSHIAFFTFLDN
jgi:hypothetical protein